MQRLRNLFAEIMVNLGSKHSSLISSLIVSSPNIQLRYDMRIKLVVLFLTVVSVSIAFCMISNEVQSKADTEACFDRISAYVSKQSPKWKENGANIGNPSFGLYTHQDYKTLVDKTWKSKDAKQSHLYRNLLIQELRSPKPEYRALSCTLLEKGFDVAAIPEIGKLLDDSTEAIPQFYSAPLYQQVSSKEASKGTIRMAAVREFASRALYSLTEQPFSSRTDFDKWWGENSNYKATSWYWRKRWEPMEGPAASVAQRIQDLSSLPDDVVIRAVILSGISWNDDDSYELLPKFLQKRHLSSRIIGMLMQQNLLPEINSQERFEHFVRRVNDLSLFVFTGKDESLIAKAEDIHLPYNPPIADLVLMRSNIAFPHSGSDLRCRVLPLNEKDKTVIILTGALRKDPTLVPVAIELVNVIGSKESAVLKHTFKSVSVYEKKDIARAVADNACWMTPAFIRELVQLVPDPNSSDYCDGGLGYLSRAANSVLHKQVISEQEIAKVEFQLGKTTSQKECEQASMYFSKVKKKLLRVLDKAE